MQRYESYLTRRVPISMQGLTPAQAAQDRLYAIRDLMRMEMPDRVNDITDGPIVLPNSGRQMTRTPLNQLYYNRLTSPTTKPSAGNGTDNGAAELLYLIVSTSCPEALEQFNASEIGDTNNNGWPEFLDGWGRPIFFLRWAPGLPASASAIQIANAVTNHDPFDPRNTEPAYQLIPLIYSSGPDGKLGIANQGNYHFGDNSRILLPAPPGMPVRARWDRCFFARIRACLSK